MTTRSTFTAALLLTALAWPLSAATPAGAAVAPTCSAAQTKVSFGHFNGTAGTFYYSLTFTNTGSTCSLSGVPAVQPVANSVTLRKVGPAARNDSIGKMGVLHTLRHGQSVSSSIGFVDTGNYSVSICRPAWIWRISVNFGNIRNRRVATAKLSVCTKISSVTTRLLGS